MAVAVIFTLSQSAAQAQLTVDGSTTGSTFDNGTKSLGGLSFKGTNFGGTTDAGGVLVLNNLGTLTITPIPSESVTSVGSFTFEVAFVRPDGVSSNPVEVFGNVFGYFTSAENFALIDFDNDAKLVTFSGSYGSGAFSIAVDDVCLGDACFLFGSDFTGKLQRHKSLNALALNNAPRGDGNVRFVKAKGSSSMFAPTQATQTFTITATIRILDECEFCDPPIPPFVPAPGCKNDGWRSFSNPSFKTQGDCVSFFNHQ